MQRAIFPWAVVLAALLATTGAAGAGVRHVTDATQLSARGGLPRTVAVGQHPFALAVDERSHRVFVLNQGPWDATFTRDATGHASVSALDASTGAVLHTTRLGVVQYLGGPDLLNDPPAPQEMAVDEQSNRLFILDTGKLATDAQSPYIDGPGWVYLLNATSGALLRTIPLPYGPQAMVVDARSNRVFITNVYSQSVSVLDATTGRLLRTTSLLYGQGPLSLALDARTNRLFVASSQGLNMLDATTGTLLLLGSEAAAPLEGIAVDARAGRVVTTAATPYYQDMRILIWDATTGALLATRQLEEFYATPLAVDATTHHAFVFADDTFHLGPYLIRMLDTRTGRTLHEEYVSPSEGASDAATMVLDAALGHLFVGVANPEEAGIGGGVLDVFDTHSGRQIHTIPLDAGFPAVAVDTRTERVFVANQADGTVSIFDANHL